MYERGRNVGSLGRISVNLVNSWRARLVHWRWWRLRHRTLTEPTTNEVSGYATSHTTRCRNKCLNSKIWPDLSPSIFLSLQYWLACPRVFHFFIYIYICTHLPAKPKSWKLIVTGCGKSWFFTCSMLSASSQLQLVSQIIYLSNKIDITFSNFFFLTDRYIEKVRNRIRYF